MKINIETSNCSAKQFYLIEEAADSEIKITLKFKKIVSRQSRKERLDELTSLIHSELKKFDWIIVGNILVDMTWYLDAVERQETDKVGDIDNITKPIIDSLSGQNGVIVDDSQIGGLYSCWMSRNDLIEENILVIQIKFNNDYALLKKNLKFIQYNNAICLPMNLDLGNEKDLLAAKVITSMRTRSRDVASKVKLSGGNIDRYFVCSEHEFHRTRLSGFEAKSIIGIDKFNRAFIDANIELGDFVKYIK